MMNSDNVQTVKQYKRYGNLMLETFKFKDIIVNTNNKTMCDIQYEFKNENNVIITEQCHA